ncbi:CAP domain-containing protein [Spirosoma sp. HMF3257]|uniref:CAP domain-containing protein n=1 Tax=Spirosoma telluris TaxID=2183553 RepID=A0A327NS29_9BACT|nr:CAP domain-containing protein [Spirosoma telluris]RAI78201.1 CAP domain-containing protein [Spirosoma telluris]
MNWWIFVQLYQWVVIPPNTPADYLLSDAAFFAQARSQQPLNLDHPDTLLLDVAIFQATNEVRRQFGLSAFLYDPGLYQAARTHAESMIQKHYYGHDNFYSLAELTSAKRIKRYTNRFNYTAENIGQYPTIDTPDYFSARYNGNTHQYEYFDVETKKLYRPFSYAGYARTAVQEWLHSLHHRASLLSPLYTHIGCAARLSPNPYSERRPPFGRLVQNFGAQCTSQLPTTH